MLLEHKSVLERAALLESKTVRHVRTPAGEAHFGQPVGSIIVRDGAKPLAHLRAVRSDYRGWDKVIGDDGNTYYTSKDENTGNYVAVGADDYVVAEHPKEEDLYRALDKLAGSKSKGDSKDKGASGPRSEARGGGKWDGDVFVTKQGKRKETKPGFRPATDEEWKAGGYPPAWQMVYVNDGSSKIEHRTAYGWDGQGNQQNKYPAAHSVEKSKEKHQRITELLKDIPKLDKALKKDAMDDDTAAVVYLMRITGIRVGGKSSHAKVDPNVEAFGASSLLGKHVTINNSSVTLHFIGKGGKEQKYVIKDKFFFDIMSKRKKDKRANDRFFDTTEAKSIAYIRSKTGKNYKNHDLRTYHGTTLALKLIAKKNGRLPKSQAEFRRWRNEVGDEVAKQLGNTRALALKSYVAPSVFEPWVVDEKWL